MLSIKEGNMRWFVNLTADDTVDTVRTQRLVQWRSDDREDRPQSRLDSPFAEDWSIDACNCTVGRAVLYGLLVPASAEVSVPKSMNAGALRLLLDGYDDMPLQFQFLLLKLLLDDLCGSYRRCRGHLRGCHAARQSHHTAAPPGDGKSV